MNNLNLPPHNSNQDEITASDALNYLYNKCKFWARIQVLGRATDNKAILLCPDAWGFSENDFIGNIQEMIFNFFLRRAKKKFPNVIFNI